MTTVETLRQHLTEQIILWQQERFDLRIAYEQREELPVETLVALQSRLAYVHNVIENAMEWLHDNGFMTEWCSNLNRRRSEYRP